MSYYWKLISPSLCAKIKCKTNGVSGDNSKWNLCFRGPKVRVNGSLWSLGNLIQEAVLITSVLTGRQPMPFLFPPFLLSLLCVLSPYFNFFFFSVMSLLLSCFHSFVLWLLWDIISSLFFSRSFPLSRWCHIHCPTFFLAFNENPLGYMWPHTYMYILFLSQYLSICFLLSLRLSFSLSPFLQWQRGEVTVCRWWRSASWMNTMGSFCFYLYLSALSF